MSFSFSSSHHYEIIREHIADVLCIKKDEITPESLLVVDLQMDSVDLLDIYMRIEKSFNIAIDLKMLPDDLKLSRINMKVAHIVMIVETLRK